MQIWSGQ